MIIATIRSIYGMKHPNRHILAFHSCVDGNTAIFFM